MRKAEIYDNNRLAGVLEQTADGEFIFRYDNCYLSDPETRGISLTLPKTKRVYRSRILFPFFFNMLSEGANKRIQCTKFRIDERDYFGLLLATAKSDTIGSITVKQII